MSVRRRGVYTVVAAAGFAGAYWAGATTGRPAVPPPAKDLATGLVVPADLRRPMPGATEYLLGEAPIPPEMLIFHPTNRPAGEGLKVPDTLPPVK